MGCLAGFDRGALSECDWLCGRAFSVRGALSVREDGWELPDERFASAFGRLWLSVRLVFEPLSLLGGVNGLLAA